MRLDDLERAWSAHGATLERSLALNERILRELLLRKVRLALAPFVLFRGLEVLLGLGALALAVPVLGAHLAEPRYLLLAGPVVALAAGLTGLVLWLLVHALRLDPARPVTVLQRELELLKLTEYRALKWALLGGTLLWLPAPLVLLEALSGVPFLARLDLGWLVANVVVGLGLLLAGQLLSRRLVERTDLSPVARRVVDALSSRSLRAAARHLEDLARFERE
ncbi:MAG TPA: hypothetical protein VF530_09530 [Planctomycetota bacterium]